MPNLFRGSEGAISSHDRGGMSLMYSPSLPENNSANFDKETYQASHIWRFRPGLLDFLAQCF